MRLGDPESWRSKGHYRAAPAIGAIASRQLARIVSGLLDYKGDFAAPTANFWKRSIAECIASNVMSSLPPDGGGWLPSARRLVRTGEAGERPVHLSEICAALGVSRRTFHRAFHEVFGMGPRQKRLWTIHSILRDSAASKTTVGTVAIQQGFYELRRFSQYYHAMLGEYPSQTRGIAPLKPTGQDIDERVSRPCADPGS